MAKEPKFISLFLLSVGFWLVVLFLACASVPAPATVPAPGTTPETQAETAFAEARARMVTEQIYQRGVIDPRVLSVMTKVPRHRFVPKEYLSEAYADYPLPIGYGQTISQPYIVALMTQYLALEPGEKVLEIGTGSGYQAAILAELTNQVYSIEIIEPLGKRAVERLKELGYNVQIKIADGYYGWPEYAPFDAIIVTAAPDHIPPPLTQQLKDGGKLVIPVGLPGFYQTLWLIERKGDQFQTTNLAAVGFVPMLGKH